MSLWLLTNRIELFDHGLMDSIVFIPSTTSFGCWCFFLARLKEDEGGVPSTVAEAHRKQLEDMDDIVRKEQQVCA